MFRVVESVKEAPKEWLRKTMFGQVHNPRTTGDRQDDAEAQSFETPPTADPDIGGPAVPEFDDEESVVIFDEAFGGVIDLDKGVPISDPLQELDKDEQAEYHAGLKDVVRAQRYAETLGMVPRRKA